MLLSPIADTALKFSASAVLRRSNSAISDVLSIAPLASSRLSATALSVGRCELTPSTSTCTSHPLAIRSIAVWNTHTCDSSPISTA